MLHIMETHVLHDKAYMDLVMTPNGIETHVLKKVEEPNVFKSVIEVPGDKRQEVVNEMTKRMKH